MPSLLPDGRRKYTSPTKRAALAAARGVKRSKEVEHKHVNEGNPATSERFYQDDETEFMMAMDRHKLATGHKFPRWSEVLGVLKGLGYHK